MNQNKTVHGITYLLLSVVVICGTIPKLYQSLTTVSYTCIVIAISLFMFSEQKRFAHQGLTVPTILWCIYTLLLFAVGYSTEKIGNGLVCVVFWLLLSQVEYLDCKFDKKKCGILFVILFIVSTVSVILNIVELINNPNIQKYVTGSYGVNTSDSSLGNTIYVFMMAIIANCIYDLSKTQHAMRKVLCLAFVVMIYFMVAISASVISGVATVVMLIARYIYGTIHSKKRLRNVRSAVMIFAIIAVLIICVLFRDEIYQYLTQTVSRIQNYQIQWRVEEIVEQLFGDSKSVTLSGRKQRYELSWNQFLSSPVFGVGRSVSRPVGTHSQILDDLARYGLIGAIAQIYILRRYMKKYLLKYCAANVSAKTTIISTFAGIAVYAAFNPIISLYSGVTIFTIQYMYIRYRYEDEAKQKTQTQLTGAHIR